MNKTALVASTILFVFVSLSGLAFSAAWASEPKTIELERDGEVILSIPLEDNSSVEIDAVTGGLRASTTSEFSCGADVGSCDDVQVSMSSTNGSFSRSPSSVVQGGSVTFSWTSRGAWECEGLDLAGTAWSSGAKVPNGSQSVAMNVNPGTYQASIRCSNGPNEAIRGPLSIEVTAPDAGIPEACTGRQPGGMTLKADCAVNASGVDCRSYEAVYRAPFPGLAQGRQIYTGRNQYIAMEFTVPSLASGSNGGWGWVVPQISPTTTGRNMQTISRCPGDFDRTKIEQEMGPNCYLKQTGLTPTVQWALVGSGSTGQCLLQPGETYYFNILYTDSPAGTPPGDLNWQCGTDPAWSQCSNNTEAIF